MDIEPALTPDEWEERCARTPNGTLRYSLAANTDEAIRDGDGNTVAYHDDLPSLMALANAALPDGDPRKITREDVAMLERDAEMSRNEYGINAGDELDALAAKLAALLPP